MNPKSKIDPPPPRGGNIPPLEFVELFGRRTWPDDTPKLVVKPIRTEAPLEGQVPPTPAGNPTESR